MADCLFPFLNVKWLLIADLIGGGPVSPFTGTDAYLKIEKKVCSSCATSVTNSVVWKEHKDVF